MQALGLSLGSSLRLPIASPLPRRCHHLDHRVSIDMHMPMLLVRDGDSGASAGVNQGSFSRHEVVHRTNSVLDCDLL
ncbi:hypothetical protein Vadar_031612 [Vaccinium darrowii]|uniref:Uncharacterized protein n=1 Tax=Vaccinium darrowii TaxID=229202 RepID=A0ACB7Z1J1_9ERIC|nr:hypothetical protein Vadar_031612 [Vaccinium darrowii]